MFNVVPTIFRTREELETYVETRLNEQGHPPELGVVDQEGDHWFAIRSAPGGDGYDFSFVSVDPDSGMVHTCMGEETGCSYQQCSLLRAGMSSRDVQPSFPVIALVRRGTR